MGGVDQSLLTLATALAAALDGVGAVFLAKCGYTYFTGGGNPRAQAEAYKSGENVIKGMLLVTSAGAIAAYLAGILKFA
jgi:hypothetical protein